MTPTRGGWLIILGPAKDPHSAAFSPRSFSTSGQLEVNVTAPHVCEGCQTPFEGRSTARFCSERCRKRAARQRAALPNPDNSADNPDTPGSVYAATLRDLEAARRVGSLAGAYCLAMAARIDRKADTGSALAALVRQLEESMAQLAQHVPDIVDELRDELAERRAGQR